jgi:hypothetical protein
MMADLQNFSVTPQSAASVNVPMFTITAQVLDDEQNIIADFTGENAIQVAGLSATLSAEQRENLIGQIATTIVLMRAGLQ